MTEHATDRMAQMRRDYVDAGLDERGLAVDWLTQFQRWFDEAVAAGIGEANAMVMATADAAGVVSARSVLAKAVDSAGIVFYTNYESTKSRAIDANPQVAVIFPWYPLHRQIRIEGLAQRVTRAETEAYWASRPRGAQIGAWTSPQSRVIPDPGELERLQAEAEQRFSDAVAIPAPAHWGGWRIRPLTVEFWQGRDDRLHDRLRFRRDAPGLADDGAWTVERLAP